MAPSITSSPSFRARLLQAERWRIGLMAACSAILLVTWLIRRAAGGVVASRDSAFIAVVGVLAAGILFSIGLFFETRWRERRGLGLPPWRFLVSAALDLAVPFAILAILHFESPRGAYAALSGPTLLFVPIVIMLSVLRLRPGASFLTGLAAAIIHWVLAIDTYRRGGLEPATAALLSTYGILLALTGVGAAVLSSFVRRYIQEAVAESQAAELAGRKLHTMEHEFGIARRIQQSLLPSKPPAVPGYQLAGMARPATQTGGDYYDWQPLADGRLVVAIADVTGHGIGPALVMAICRAYTRATAPALGTAAEFLDRMNALICKDVSDGRFITMAVAIASPDGSVDLLSAGHGPTFCYRAAAGAVERFGGDGLPLGLVEAETYGPIAHLRLDPGDCLILITDGFMEQLNPSEAIFGIDRLSAAIAQHATLPPADLIAALDRAVMDYASDTPQGDDMSAVVLRRTTVVH